MTTTARIAAIARDTNLTPGARLLLIAALNDGPAAHRTETTIAHLTDSTPHRARAHLVELRKAGYIERRYVDTNSGPVATYALTLPTA